MEKSSLPIDLLEEYKSISIRCTNLLLQQKIEEVTAWNAILGIHIHAGYPREVQI